MNLMIFVKRWRALPLAQRQLLFVAAVVAVALLSLYVQLLHDSLARGNELREALRTSGSAKPARAMVPPTQTGVVLVRETAGTARPDAGSTPRPNTPPALRPAP